ncbi:MAG: hypothetical protein RLY93_15975 [Sumerlaeia bacterium]
MNRFFKSQRKGLFLRATTLTELLVVLAIISLLATLAVPVYVQKSEQARRAVARAEVREIANAEEAVIITHGFVVPMHVLDNVPNLDNGGTDVRDDFENDSNDGTKFVIDPFIPLDDQFGSQQTLSSSDDKVERMIAFWQGPFLNPGRVFQGTSGDNNTVNANQEDISTDILLDPWGRPYRLYSDLGLTGDEPAPSAISQIALTTNSRARNFDNGRLTNDDDRFDRFAVLSYGSNGIADDGVGGDLDDDIFYTFGTVVNETSFNLF